MAKTIGVAVIAVLMANSALAAPRLRHHSGVRVIQNCRCYTDQSSCSGQALFSSAPQDCAISGYPQSCAIYYARGGESDIYLFEAGQSFALSVGYRDKYACVPGTAGVPSNTPRDFIGVK
jgi:hypothetical protein